jgi:Spy/CpxP family protein refolding chaperone
MKIKTGSFIALLALAVSAPLAFAQDGAQAQQTPPPAQQNQPQTAPRRPMEPGEQIGPQGQMRRGPMNGQTNGTAREWANGRIHHPMGPRERMWARDGMGRDFDFAGRDGFAGARGNFGGRGMGRGPGMGGRGPMPLARIVNNPDLREKLGITPEQAAKIRQQETDFRKAGVMNRAKLEVAHMELDQLMSADKPDRAAIDRKLSEISAAQLVSEQTRVHHQLDMNTALTPDQQAKLKELMQSRRPGMGGPSGPQGPGRGGRGGRGQNPQGQGTGVPEPADGTIA